MSLFGDTVEPIPKTTKRMRHNMKDKKRKQDQVEGTEKFPQGTTEWLGYGATVRAKFKGKSVVHGQGCGERTKGDNTRTVS